MSEQVSKIEDSPAFTRWLNPAQFLGICVRCKAERTFQKAQSLLGTRWKCNVCSYGFHGTPPQYEVGEPNNPDKPRIRSPREAFIGMTSTREIKTDHQSSEVGARVPALTMLPEEWESLIDIYQKGGEAALIDLIRDEKGEIPTEFMLIHPDRHLREYETRVNAVKRVIAQRENDKKAELQAKDAQKRFERYYETTHVKLEPCGCLLLKTEVSRTYSESIQRAQRNGWKISKHMAISCSQYLHETKFDKEGNVIGKDWRDHTAMRRLLES